MSQMDPLTIELEGLVLTGDGRRALSTGLAVELGPARLLQGPPYVLTEEDKNAIAAAVIRALEEYLVTAHGDPDTPIPVTLIRPEDYAALTAKDPDRLYLLYGEDGFSITWDMLADRPFYDDAGGLKKLDPKFLPTVRVGSVTTLPAGESAAVTCTADALTGDLRLDLALPRGNTGPRGEQGPQGEPGIPGADGSAGETGPQGEQGPQGDTGPCPTLVIGSVTTGSPGTSADATITDVSWTGGYGEGTYRLDLTIPQGESADPSEAVLTMPRMLDGVLTAASALSAQNPALAQIQTLSAAENVYLRTAIRGILDGGQLPVTALTASNDDGVLLVPCAAAAVDDNGEVTWGGHAVLPVGNTGDLARIDLSYRSSDGQIVMRFDHVDNRAFYDPNAV